MAGRRPDGRGHLHRSDVKRKSRATVGDLSRPGFARPPSPQGGGGSWRAPSSPRCLSARWLGRGPDLGAHHPAAYHYAASPAPSPATSARFATRVPAQEMAGSMRRAERAGLDFGSFSRKASRLRHPGQRSGATASRNPVRDLAAILVRCSGMDPGSRSSLRSVRLPGRRGVLTGCRPTSPHRHSEHLLRLRRRIIPHRHVVPHCVRVALARVAVAAAARRADAHAVAGLHRDILFFR